MKKNTIFKARYYNDPIYGILQFPFSVIQSLIDHPYLQRLRRITQCGLLNYVYPGANHTRFLHTLGVTHLISEVVKSLISKGIKISPKDHEAACIAALLHDIGHGPYSHALEQRIVPLHHENISAMIAEKLNVEFNGKLVQAIKILSHKHPKKFLSQLISGQLDVDRLDYLIRDSFYTGVAEGNIGYERLIHSFNVHDNRLVIEQKAVPSVEKFLISRHFMYSQVYMHKTVLALEQMLILLIERIKYLIQIDVELQMTPSLYSLLRMDKQEISNGNFIPYYLDLDDFDFMHIIKMGVRHADFIFSYLCRCLNDRNIFKIHWIKSTEKQYLILSIRLEIKKSLGVSDDDSAFLIRSGEQNSTSYLLDEEIEILSTDNQIIPLSGLKSISFSREKYSRSFICFPRDLHS